ncbi:MAG: outer membrane beta-barrel protein [Candidatus Neomarinimicrobiota bacterium]
MMKRTRLFLVLAALSLIPLWAGEGLSISGYVDGSAALPVEDGTDLGFSFDGLEIDLEKEFTEGVSLRADIDLVEGGADVEQGYVTFTPLKLGSGSSPVVTFGKFNAPIGYELLDAPDMWQYSHSLVFDNALPTNLTGFSVAHEIGGGVDFVAYLANGWDVNFADDSLMIFGGRIGYGGIEGVGLGVSFIQNDAQDMIIDLDGEVTMVPNLTVGFEFNTGTKDKDDADITGWLVMANYDLGFMAVTFRQDSWGDASSTTISPSKGIADGAGMLFEFRIDDDGAGTTTNSAAIEFTFSF